MGKSFFFFTGAEKLKGLRNYLFRGVIGKLFELKFQTSVQALTKSYITSGSK